MSIPNLDKIFKDPSVKMGFQGMFPDEAFNGVLEQGVKMMQEFVREKKPTVFEPHIVMAMKGPEPGVFVVGLAPVVGGIDDRRFERLCIMGRMAFENHVNLCAAYIQSEAWTCVDKEEGKRIAQHNMKGGTQLRIADLPPERRREVLIFSGFTLDGRSNAIALNMKRDEEGRIVDCSEVAFNGPYSDVAEDNSFRVHAGLPSAFVTGWLCGLLVKSGMAKGDPMDEVLSEEGIDISELKHECEGDCGGECSCGGEDGPPKPWEGNPDAWKNRPREG